MNSDESTEDKSLRRLATFWTEWAAVAGIGGGTAGMVGTTGAIQIAGTVDVAGDFVAGSVVLVGRCFAMGTSSWIAVVVAAAGKRTVVEQHWASMDCSWLGQASMRF